MFSTIITIVAAACAFNWLNRYVCNIALLLYIQEQYNTLPAEEELKACLTEAWRKTLHIK